MAIIDSQSPRVKRRRIDNTGGSGPAAASNITDITSHTQLRDLLVFQQSANNETKQGINKFKNFLTSISNSEKENEKAKKLRILKAYCDSQFSKVGDGDDAICFPDMIQTWSFAESNNHESLLTVVPSVLALFIKTVSNQLEFRDFGLALCKYLMQKEQLRLLNRGLTSSKAKEHLISPCIRLLTEIVSFDGGAVARLVYSKRDITFKRIEIFLTPNKAQIEDVSDEGRKSTLRRNAQRYVLANLRFQHVSAKSDIIEQHKVIRAFLEFVRKDSRDVVIDIIRAIEKDIVNDSSLSRNSRSRFFNKWNLERLVTLYGYDRESEEPNPENISVANEIHKLLLKVCTTPELGVLLPETGWYPLGSDPETIATEDDGSIDLGLDSPVYVDKYRENVPIRNGTLSALVQVLRPESDTLQIELLLAIFRAAPELVADFFTKRTMFTSDPKPTPSWLGESAFLFSTVQLPVPANCGWKDKVPAMPPPVSVVIENVLPRPLTQKILSRCLNQNTEVVTLFAVRILTVAFRKLQAVLRVFNGDHGIGQPFWSQASSKLIAEFCRRCPPMKDAILLFKRTAKEDLQQQDAVAELLSMFYEVIPTVAFEENFDVSLVIVDILKQLEKDDMEAEDRELLLSQLQNVLNIAQRSASMRWWQQPASLQYSAFTSILKVLVEARGEESLGQIRKLLQSVVVEHSVLHNPDHAFHALVSSLENTSGESLASQLAFLDNCICRLVKKPVHYQDLLDSLLEKESAPISLLLAAINEQWPFIVKNGNAAQEEAVATWIARFMKALKQAGEDPKALRKVADSLAAQTELKKTKSAIKKALKSAEASDERVDGDNVSGTRNTQSASKATKSVDLAEVFGSLPTESKSHNVLHKWEKEELELAVEQGQVAGLMLCLCSEHDEIRRQAAVGISRLMMKLKDSKYVEWRPVYILAGELLETMRKQGFENPLPWIAGECAASCLRVLTDPLHKLYGKVNLFLQKAPSWEVVKLPSYWIDKILLHEPEYDDGYFEEIDWLLDLFVKGLRTESDLEIYRRANVFERLLSLYNSPTLATSAKRKILHVIYRATQVGGSTTLVTRAATISWIQSQIAGLDNNDLTIKALANAVHDTADHDRINKWSSAALPHVVEHIAG
ncbi:hypothetical protein DTO169E5_8493 [Paecilomyces variotii]|nr:hypothetical protein DTO169E5_8493 [Paecilomyces variotii]